jgi:hypothetical protein
MLGCSIGNSKSQLHKARLKLRDLLKINRANKVCQKRTKKQQEVTMATGRGASAAATAA